jgi:4-hydroxy-tetrahydrodipicolinate synthase
MKELFGTGVALVTPFDKNGSVDHDALRKLVSHQIENGINYLVVLGTTGEPATLSSDEKEAVKQTVIEENEGRLPLVLGIGGNNTARVVHEVSTCDLSEFTAVLSVSPYYNRPSQEGIFQHFKAISDACPKPLIVYNVPSRTGQNMTPDTTIRLARECPSIVAVKEAAGDQVQAMRLLQNKPKDFLIISGDDMLALPMVQAGGAGVISVIGQGFPKDFSTMIKHGLEGRQALANRLQYKIMDSIDYIFEEGNPAGIKALLHAKGLVKPYVRLPLIEVTVELRQKIDNFVAQYKY